MDARQWSIERYYFESSKSVTVVGIECCDATFKLHFKFWNVNMVRIECDDATFKKSYYTVKNGVNSIHSWGVPQTCLKLPPRVYSKGVYVPSRV